MDIVFIAVLVRIVVDYGENTLIIPCLLQILKCITIRQSLSVPNPNGV